MLILALLALTTLGVCLVAWRTRDSLSAIARVEAGPVPVETPLVSVVIPARNEASNVVPLLGDLLAQDYPNVEIVLVDDQSTDGTGELASEIAGRDRRVRVLRGQPLESGWTGKCFALHQGERAASGDWLLFTDADTRHHPSTISALVREAESRRVDMLSLITFQVLGSFWERVVQPVVLGGLVLATPFRVANDPRRPDFALANGQVILIRRSVYDKVGGHESVRSEIVEDFALARRVKREGHRLLFLNGMGLVRTRMYRGLRDLWDGWSKNAFLGPGGGVPLALGGLVFVTLLGVGPFVAWVAAALLAVLQGGGSPLVLLGVATLHVAVVVYGWSKVCRTAFQLPRRYGLGLPLGALILDGILINSAYRHVSGRGITWKGRQYREKQGATGGAAAGD